MYKTDTNKIKNYFSKRSPWCSLKNDIRGAFIIEHIIQRTSTAFKGEMLDEF